MPVPWPRPPGAPQWWGDRDGVRSTRDTGRGQAAHPSPRGSADPTPGRLLGTVHPGTGQDSRASPGLCREWSWPGESHDHAKASHPSGGLCTPLVGQEGQASLPLGPAGPLPARSQPTQLTIQPEVFKATICKVILHDGHEGGHLAEEQHFVVGGTKFGENSIQQLKLA